LLQRRRYIHVLAFGFHHRNGYQANEQHIVGRSAVREPFGNGEVFIFLGASALRIDQGCGIHSPACLPELLIDQLARLGLVEVYCRHCGVRRGDERGHGLPGLRGSLGLLGGEPLLQCHLCRLSLASHLLPEGLLVPGLTQPGLCGVQTQGGFLICSMALFERLTEAGEFGAQLGAFVRRSLRRDEGARLERGIPEGAVKPERELPGDLEGGKSSAMVPRYGVARGVAGAPHFTEELGNLTRQHALVLQAAQQVVLGLLR
jgi:hypothetical protein